MASILSYLSIILITFFFTYIFDIKENYLLLYMIIIAPVFDYLLFLYSKKSVNFKVNIKDENLEKRQYTECIFEIENKAVFPIIRVSYEVLINGKFECIDFLKERISIAARSTTIKNIELRAVHRGIGEISVEKLEIKSLLGLFTGEIDTDEYIQNRIIITPALVEVEGVDKLIDDTVKSEDSDETSNNMFIGEPGYDFKEYAEGDPLSKVNWKISSKRNILMIRKHATDVKHKKVIIIDPEIVGNRSFEDYGDLIIEAAIGVCKELYSFDFEVDLIFKEGRSWNEFAFVNMDSIASLQTTFSAYNFNKLENGNNRFGNFHCDNEDSCDFLIITTNKDNVLSSFATSLMEHASSVNIISNNKVKVFDEEYYLNQDYSLGRI